MSEITFQPLFTWRSAIVDSALSPQRRLVALVLSLHMNELGGSCFPSYATLARETGLSRRTVIRSVQDLVSGGWLGLELGNSERSNRYTAIWPGGGVTDALVVGGVVSEKSRGGVTVTPEGVKRASESSLHRGVVAEKSRNGSRNARARAWSVDRQTVTEEEEDQARAILASWNEQTGQALTARDWLRMIVMRIREHPELTPNNHAAVIEEALKYPWWSGLASPNVIYGNGAQFERQLMALQDQNGRAEKYTIPAIAAILGGDDDTG
jgi:hypothetical protein